MENYRNCTDEQLQDTQVILLEDMASIRYQLEAAKSNAAAGGEYADAEWFRKATYALRMKGAQQQAVSLEVGRRKRLNQSRLETWFVRTAREILEEDLFDEIMDEAMDKVRSNAPDPSGE